MKKTHVYDWYKRFRDGRASVSDDPRCGRSSTSTNDENVKRVRNVVASDRGKSIQEISAEVGISVGSVRSILHEDS
jgi:transposase